MIACCSHWLKKCFDWASPSPTCFFFLSAHIKVHCCHCITFVAKKEASFSLARASFFILSKVMTWLVASEILFFVRLTLTQSIMHCLRIKWYVAKNLWARARRHCASHWLGKCKVVQTSQHISKRIAKENNREGWFSNARSQTIFMHWAQCSMLCNQWAINTLIMDIDNPVRD